MTEAILHFPKLLFSPSIMQPEGEKPYYGIEWRKGLFLTDWNFGKPQSSLLVVVKTIGSHHEKIKSLWLQFIGVDTQHPPNDKKKK